MLLPVPDGVPDEVAVLADPFAVALHAVTRNPPPPGGRAVVYGAGALGTCATAILRLLHPDVEVATVARVAGPGARSPHDSARTTFAPEPRLELVEALAAWSGGVLRQPWDGLPVALARRHRRRLRHGRRARRPSRSGCACPGHGARSCSSGVSLDRRGSSGRRWYFKEVRADRLQRLRDRGGRRRRKHAIAHYLDLVAAGRVDLAGMLTHTFPLEDWRDAFRTLIDQGETGAIKVAFDLRSAP